MTARIFEDQGAGALNQATVVGRVQSTGPLTVLAQNLSEEGNAVLSFSNQRTGLSVLSDKDTAVSAEDTGYDGDTTETSFTGQTLNNLPVVPGSVVVVPTAGGDSVNLYDRDGDGQLYTVDDDEDFAGTVNYFTGALVLNFPVGKEPNTGDIDCNYAAQDAALVPGGIQSYGIANVPHEDTIVVKAASSTKGGVKVKLDSIGRAV